MDKRYIGSVYEDLAAGFLEREGYRILEYNFSCRMGEIDMIARDGETLVFVEVKYRKSTAAGYAEEAVNYRKQRQISRVAAYFMIRNRIPDTVPCRFDVVAINAGRVRLYKNAFPFRR